MVKFWWRNRCYFHPYCSIVHIQIFLTVKASNLFVLLPVRRICVVSILLAYIVSRIILFILVLACHDAMNKFPEKALVCETIRSQMVLLVGGWKECRGLHWCANQSYAHWQIRQERLSENFLGLISAALLSLVSACPLGRCTGSFSKQRLIIEPKKFCTDQFWYRNLSVLLARASLISFAAAGNP